MKHLINSRAHTRFLIKRCLSTSSSTSADSRIKHLISQGSYEQALIFYVQHVHPMQQSSNTAFTVPSIIKACAHSPTSQIHGLQIHCNVLKNGFDSDPTVANSVLTMYAKFSDPTSAKKVFNEMPERDLVSWSSMTNCYIQNGFFLEALEMFKGMYLHALMPKSELIASCLSSCIKSESWRLGRAIHGLVLVDERIDNSCFLSTALVDFYWRCGDKDAAFSVFNTIEEKNEVSWTAMISGCVEHQDYATALACVREMQVQNIRPNRVTLLSILPAFVGLKSSRHAKEIHAYALHQGYSSDARFLSALLHAYCECEHMFRYAKVLFDKCASKPIFMWSSMITTYSKSKDNAGQAFDLFNEMRNEGIKPNTVTLLPLISACGNLSSPNNNCGAMVHCYALKSRLNKDTFFQNAVIAMYSKWGNLNGSVRIFDETSDKDRVSWTSIINAYGLHGQATHALSHFFEMQESGIKPDGLVYLAVLSSCNHAGLVEEGRAIFEQAMKDENVCLSTEHYACYVDLLGRAGKIEDAYDVVCGMSVDKLRFSVLSSLVSWCRVHGRFDIAESLAVDLVRIEPENAGNHALLSMVYAESENWPGVEELRRFMKKRKLRKMRGFSRI